MRRSICSGLVFLSLAGGAYAQSSVTISGLVDAGVTYISNQGGKQNLLFDDGIAVPNLLTFSGKEDLGGGMKAIFDLTNQFSLGTGSFLPGQSLFSRDAYVGLDSERLGKLTFGSQLDFMTDSLFFGFDDAAIYSLGLYNLRNGPFDKLALPDNPTGAFDWDRMAGVAIANSVKYRSPVVGGLSAGVMYGFGNVAGSIGADNGQSYGLDYTNGAFGADAAYTLVKSTSAGISTSVTTWGFGTHYHLGSVTASALYTAVRNAANGVAVWQTEFGAVWQVTPVLALSAVYEYMKGNDVVDNNHAHEGTLSAQYWFSKRTSVYAGLMYQRANDGANAQINNSMVASSSPSQFVARVGVQTRF